MSRSRLRSLVAAHADGMISGTAYRARRRELIDAVTDGDLDIGLEDRAAALDGAAAPPPVNGAGQSARAHRPGPALLAAAFGACVLVLAVLLWPSQDQEPVGQSPPVVPVLPTIEVSRARTLVESFLARRDFSDGAVSEFREGWQALTESERDDARATPWFNSLAGVLSDEVTTQNALAALGAGDPATLRARRVLALGELLGVSAQLPDVNQAPPPAAVERVTQTPDTASAPTAGPVPPAAEAPATPEIAGAESTPVASAGSAPGTTETASDAAASGTEDPSAQRWLDARGDDELTLQLFAVNQLDGVEKLRKAHPELELRILQSTGNAAPRYRVFHGVFQDAAAARSAYERIPADVSAASAGAIVKSFAAVREDLLAPPHGGTAAKPTAQARNRYTLQLFASGSRPNAEALLGAFPALPLQLREVAGNRTPYRVVYGDFQSEAAARSAAATLPPALVSRTGKPIAKALSDTGTPLTR